MKTTELKKIVEENGYKTTLYLEWIDISKDDVKLGYVSTRTVQLFNIYDTLRDKVIAQAILDYAYTPLEEREEEEKKYIVYFEISQCQLSKSNGASEHFVLSSEYVLDKTKFTLKELRELDFLKEIDGKWYMKLELEEVK